MELIVEQQHRLLREKERESVEKNNIIYETIAMATRRTMSDCQRTKLKMNMLPRQ